MTIGTFFRALEKARVRYCLIGRSAAVYYGLTAVTFDIDILLARGVANVKRFFKALRCLRVRSDPPSKLELELFLSEKVTRYEIDGRLFDVLKWQDGFCASAWPRVKKVPYRGVTVRIADLRDLIQTKAQTPRRRDKADVRALTRILRSKEAAR